MSITGVGLIVASVMWARIGDASRFRSSKAVVRYAGLDPSVYQSGGQDRHGHISRAGASDLRRALVQAVYQAGLHDTGPIGKFFRRKEKELGRKRAVVATARKLL
ncbi:MAG TPA: IS110 family transposase [Firmicutes bacterium]|nr:IS110 family transposase [Candidatus Fermentithermobacillaceae bacterium]